MKKALFLSLIFFITSITYFAQEKEVPQEKPLFHSNDNYGVMLGKAVRLPNPAYPSCICKVSKGKRFSSQFTRPNESNAGRATRCSCTASRVNNVIVQFTVDEEGKVESATAILGHSLLRPLSISAILNSKFSISRIDSKPVKAIGIITYEFVLSKDEWQTRFVNYDLKFEKGY